MPIFAYFGMPLMSYDPMAYSPFGYGGFPMNQILQKPQVPIIQKKLTEEEKIIEDAISNYYQKYSSTHKICECEACERLTLPFMVKWDISDEEKIEIEKNHKDYLEELINQNESLGIESPKKINNLFSKQIFLGELKFKLKEE